MPKICTLCRENFVTPYTDYCNECGAELFEQWKADRDMREMVKPPDYETDDDE